MEAEQYAAWLEAREGNKLFLFGESNGDSLSSLAAIAFTTSLAGAKPHEIERSRDIFESVSAILTTHDARARTENQALFGFVNANRDIEAVSAITAHTIWRWDRAWARYNRQCGIQDEDRPSPFAELPKENVPVTALEQRSVQLVVEAASAVIETLQSGYRSNTHNSTTCTLIANFIAQHGPNFATAWIRGDILLEYCRQSGLNANQWLGWIGPGLRKQIALKYPKDPLNKVIDIITRANDELSTQNLVAATGWSELEVERVFSMSLRIKLCRRSKDALPEAQAIAERLNTSLEVIAEIAIAHNMDPAAVEYIIGPGRIREIIMQYGVPHPALERIITNYQAISAPNIMDELGMSREQVDAQVPEYARRQLSRSFTGEGSIMSKVRDLRIRSSELMQLGLSPALAINIASRYPNMYRTIGGTVQTAVNNPPAHVGSAEWASAVALYPHDLDNTRRMAVITQHRLWLSILRPELVDALVNRGTTLDKSVMNNSAETIFLASEPEDMSPVLHRLAQRSGVSEQELTALLAHYSNEPGEAPVNHNELTSLLGKLRRAAKE